MAKYGKKSPKEIADGGKQRLVDAFIKTKKTTPPVSSKTSKDQADQN